MFRQPVHEELVRALHDDLALTDMNESGGLEPGRIALRVHPGAHTLQDPSPKARTLLTLETGVLICPGHREFLLMARLW